MELHNSPLGKQIDYKSNNDYNPKLLFAIARDTKRQEIGIVNDQLPFFGIDVWNHYEVSWLDNYGKPHVAIAIIEVPATSQFIFESKSLKLYFNSLNNHKFKDSESVSKTITTDLSSIVKEDVIVQILPITTNDLKISSPLGICVDDITTTITEYTVNPKLLKSESVQVENETIYSNLLRSNCLITNQPDWATISVNYSGSEINHESFLKYIASFRNHNEFHEQCVERIFMQLLQNCNLTELTVTGRFTRRGGIDINPIRSNKKDFIIQNLRLIRQ